MPSRIRQSKMPHYMSLLFSLDSYKTTEPWSGFGTIVGLTEDEIVGIYEIKSEELRNKTEGSWYSLDGKKLSTPPKGHQHHWRQEGRDSVKPL